MALSGPAARSEQAPANDRPEPAAPPNAPAAPADQAPAPVFRSMVHERLRRPPLRRPISWHLFAMAAVCSEPQHGAWAFRRLAAVGLITLNADSRGTQISLVRPALVQPRSAQKQLSITAFASTRHQLAWCPLVRVQRYGCASNPCQCSRTSGGGFGACASTGSQFGSNSRELSAVELTPIVLGASQPE
jgi:hypothetical protein